MQLEEIEIQLVDRKIKAFVSDLRIDRETVPTGCYVYGCRHSDDAEVWICHIKKYVMVNHACDIVTTNPIAIIEHGGDIYLDEDYQVTYSGRYKQFKGMEVR